MQAEATAALGDGGAFEVGRRDAAVKQNLERDICALKEKAQAAICAHLEACIARKCNELEEFVERLLHDARYVEIVFVKYMDTWARLVSHTVLPCACRGKRVTEWFL